MALPDVIDDLRARGLLEACTDEDALRARIAAGPIRLYCGFDPTAPSLHVGHLQGLAVLRLFGLHGHDPIPLVGGFTGMVGDPSGRSSERNLLSAEDLDHNRAGLQAQMTRLLAGRDGAETTLVDNRDWFEGMTLMEFLRDVGKLESVSDMLERSSVKLRLESESGLSFTEFSYQLLQAHDFVHLRRALDCELQVGGSDQYGNITAGTDMIRRNRLGRAFGLVWPLLLRRDGTKFGKSEGENVWLDAELTRPFAFHQFWFNQADDDVESLLLKFTTLSVKDIRRLMADHREEPSARRAQAVLADELTQWVHGPEACEKANRIRSLVFSGPLDRAGVDAIADEIPTIRRDAASIREGSLAELLHDVRLVSSVGDGRRAIAGGGVYVNGERATEAWGLDSDASWLLLARGRRSHALVLVEA